MKLYQTELEIGFKNKEFLVESNALDLKNFLEEIRCVLSSDKVSSGYKIYGFVDTLASLKCDRCLVIFENEFQVKIDVILSNNNEMEIRGKTAFFAPLIFTSPKSGLPPCIINLSLLII